MPRPARGSLYALDGGAVVGPVDLLVAEAEGLVSDERARPRLQLVRRPCSEEGHGSGERAGGGPGREPEEGPGREPGEGPGREPGEGTRGLSIAGFTVPRDWSKDSGRRGPIEREPG